MGSRTTVEAGRLPPVLERHDRALDDQERIHCIRPTMAVVLARSRHPDPLRPCDDHLGAALVVHDRAGDADR